MIQAITFFVLIIALIIFFRHNSKNKSKWGINFKRVYCPVCHTKQPVIRIPDSRAQAAWGGTTCPNCGAKLDKYGGVID
jgi:RNase P subunit RPR2